MQLYLKRDCDTGVFLWILRNFLIEHLWWLLLSAYFPHANTQMPSRNRMQSIIMVATCMFLQTSSTVNHTRYTSALGVSAQQYLISFETEAYCSEFEHNFFNKLLREECTCFICGNSWDLTYLMILCVK